MIREDSVALRVLAAVVVCAATALSNEMRAADFSGVGYLSPGDDFSFVEALSRDGSAFIGNSYRSFTFDFPDGPQYFGTYNRAYIQDANGKRSIETPPYENYFGGDQVTDVAPHGSAVFIRSNSNPQQIGEQTFGQYSDTGQQIWTPDGGFVPLDDGVYPRVFAGDRNTYVGKMRVTSDSIYAVDHAFRYTPSGGYTDLGWIRPTHAPTNIRETLSEATGVSTDGQVVVGTNTATAEYPGITNVWPPNHRVPDPDGFEAFRWTPDGGMEPLGFLPGTDNSSANGVSGDGKVIFGQSSTADAALTSTGYRWTEATGMTAIAPLRDRQSAIMNAANFDGSVLVGTSAYQIARVSLLDNFDDLNFPINDAVIWDAVHGLRELKAVLESDYGIDVGDFLLTSATDISDDGRTIIGNGINPQGQAEGWIVHLDPVAVPEPATLALIAIGASAALVYRRRRSHLVQPDFFSSSV
jgi:uncharacterized membrane protein